MSWGHRFPIPEDSVFAVHWRDWSRATGTGMAPGEWQWVLEEAYWREADLAARIDKAMNEPAPILRLAHSVRVFPAR